MNAWWGAAVAVGVMSAGGWLLRRVEAWSHSVDESSAAWLAAAIEGGAVFEDVLGMTDLELGDHDCVRAGEQAVYQAWVLEPVVLEAQLVVRESRQRLGHLYVGGEQR